MKMGNIFTLVLVVLSWTAYAADPKVEKLSQQKTPDLHEPPMQIETLSNGVKLYYKQDTELPAVNLKTYFTFGKINDPHALRGISRVFIQALRTGGTQEHTADEVDQILDFKAAEITPQVEDEFTSLTLHCLSKDFSSMLATYFELIQQPAFEESRLDVIRKQMLNEIPQRNENRIRIAAREFRQSLYGEQSPYASLFNAETVQAITREVIADYYQKHVGPSVMMIAATSPLSFREFKKQLSAHLEAWEVTVQAPERPTSVEKTWTPSVEFINKEGTQSAMVLGHFGVHRLDPNKYKIIVANNILGGDSISSKLGKKIRIEKGLAYTVRSLFDPATDLGYFLVYTQTKSASTVEAYQEIQTVLKDLVQNKSITDADLAEAKQRIINSLVFEYETSFGAVRSRLMGDFYGYPSDYFYVTQKEIEKITLQDLYAMLPKYFFPDRLKVVMVGQKDAVPGLEQVEGLVEKPLDSE